MCSAGGGAAIEQLQPGLHGVSNGQLHAEWPKVCPHAPAVWQPCLTPEDFDQLQHDSRRQIPDAAPPHPGDYWRGGAAGAAAGQAGGRGRAALGRHLRGAAGLAASARWRYPALRYVSEHSAPALPSQQTLIDALRLHHVAVIDSTRTSCLSSLRTPLCADVDWETDALCSSIFVPDTQWHGRFYGTRSQTVVRPSATCRRGLPFKAELSEGSPEGKKQTNQR